LIIATSAADGKHINACIEAGVPTVMVDRLLDDVNCDSVTVDNYAATYDAISLAIRKGHKKIGIVRGQTNIYSDIIRYQAFIDALNDHDIEIREEYIGHSDDLLIHDSKRQFMRLLNQKDAPTLIFCPNVYLALGAFEARLEFGLSIPDEVSVLTFDHLPSFPHFSFLECIQPGFASIRQPLELIAETTADLLIKRMNDGIDAYAPIRKELKTTLINMESIKDLTAQK
ncbi:MAG: substrate-binding domain-containing protein, partial [Christensenellaceae bacterium]